MHKIRVVPAAIAVLVCVLALGCGRRAERQQAPQPATSPPPSAPASSGEDTGHPKIVALGDSLTAGHGLLEMEAYPALLQQKLNEDGYAWDVMNAGISGDTSAAGLQRLDWALQQGDVRILILELGANDGLRGLAVPEMQKNLGAIIAQAQGRGISVLLVGMEAPPNFGPQYATAFHQVYRDLARQYHVPLVPFMLDKVAGIPELNQADGIHPNVQGTKIVADTIWNALKPMVDAANAS